MLVLTRLFKNVSQLYPSATGKKKNHWLSLSELFIYFILALFDSGRDGCVDREPLVTSRQIVQLTCGADSVPQPVQNRSAACQPIMSSHTKMWTHMQTTLY